ncbi:DUF541 domain-containing protein [Candidatus Microgenomates bacterium]|nr:MAG: DUF541 domain-containing protein [Candidatus Microgenomates bacterium]
MKELKTPFFTVLFIFVGFFLYTKLFGSIPFSINSIQTTKSNLFQVTGTGKVTQVPNTALVSMGVTKNAATVLEAQNKINSVTDAIIKDLKELGINDKDIKTTNYSIYPNYQYTTGKQEINGYTATQNLEVRIKPIDKANQAIDKVTADGANVVGGATFVLDEKTQKELENKARQEAVKDAKERAQSLAEAAGIKLGRIIDVQENMNQPYPIRLGVAAPAEKSDQSTNITPGENTVTTTVTLFFETL